VWARAAMAAIISLTAVTVSLAKPSAYGFGPTTILTVPSGKSLPMLLEHSPSTVVSAATRTEAGFPGLENWLSRTVTPVGSPPADLAFATARISAFHPACRNAPTMVPANFSASSALLTYKICAVREGRERNSSNALYGTLRGPLNFFKYSTCKFAWAAREFASAVSLRSWSPCVESSAMRSCALAASALATATPSWAFVTSPAASILYWSKSYLDSSISCLCSWTTQYVETPTAAANTAARASDTSIMFSHPWRDNPSIRRLLEGMAFWLIAISCAALFAVALMAVRNAWRNRN
jgi:hypothetical protein